jgi:hypothetical protein
VAKTDKNIKTDEHTWQGLRGAPGWITDEFKKFIPTILSPPLHCAQYAFEKPFPRIAARSVPPAIEGAAPASGSPDFHTSGADLLTSTDERLVLDLP